MAVSTPICDFVRAYDMRRGVRAHMPGHKGWSFIGCERLDITEIAGADSLYEAGGIIAQSEAIASKLFGSGATYYSTEGSTQCIKAMLFLAMREGGVRARVLAGRNAHRAFIYACGMLDLDISWLMPEKAAASVCACPITPEGVERALKAMEEPPVAVYITAPDYLGGSPDIESIACVCHKYGTPFIVDNAHGAYLRFLEPSRHPLDLGADMCCDSAHKTLPVLTGGAYLHISQGFLGRLRRSPRQALALFGSTSPSYLILQSLDMCNRYISEGYPQSLAAACMRTEGLKGRLKELGYSVADSDPLKLTVFDGAGGRELADRLRLEDVECEFADRDAVVMMFTPENTNRDFERILHVFEKYSPQPFTAELLPALPYPIAAMTPREALLAERRSLPVMEAVGRICADPSVSCPPAVPVAASGEVITREAAKVLLSYGIDRIETVK